MYCVVVRTDIQLLVIFYVFLLFSFFLFFLSGNAVLQLHTFYSIVAMLLCVVLFAP